MVILYEDRKETIPVIQTATGLEYLITTKIKTLVNTNKKTIGIGAGQMSRVDSAKIASQKNSEMEKSEENSLENSVVASDAFFPFADGLLVTISSGAKAVIQPGGSVKDDDVIEAANKAGISMVFTGVRHFRH